MTTDSPVLCDAVFYEMVPDADYDIENACTNEAHFDVVLSDGRSHPRCSLHVPPGKNPRRRGRWVA